MELRLPNIRRFDIQNGESLTLRLPDFQNNRSPPPDYRPAPEFQKNQAPPQGYRPPARQQPNQPNQRPFAKTQRGTVPQGQDTLIFVQSQPIRHGPI